MATQISGNYYFTAYNKPLNNSTLSQPYSQYPSAYKRTIGYCILIPAEFVKDH